MTTRRDNDVTLSHADADRVARFLQDFADRERRFARQTKNKALATCATQRANEAQRIVNEITTRLWSWEPTTALTSHQTEG